MLSSCDLKFVSSAYPRAGFRIPRTDKNSGKSLIKLENSSTANASIGKPKYLIPQDLGFVTLDTPFPSAGADISEHTLVAFLYKS